MNAIISHSPKYAAIYERIAAYTEREQATVQDTYTYLFKRLFYAFGVNVYTLTDDRNPEQMLIALQRHGHLDRFYSLVTAELTVADDY